MLQPGTYTFTITGYSDKTPQADAQTATATFTWTLLDPCDRPDEIVSDPAPVDQHYTITDTAKSYTIPAFTITRDYCEVDYVLTFTTLTDDDSGTVYSPISKTGERTITASFSDTLDPVGKSQTVTLTATSKSKYGTFNANSLTKTYVWTYKNPCLDRNFVNIAESGTLLDQEYVLFATAKSFA